MGTVTRNSMTLRLMAWIKDKPYIWISAFDFEQFGPLCWRTEISRARKRFQQANDGTIENRISIGFIDGKPWRRSEYRYVPQSAQTDETRTPHNLNSFQLR